MEGDSPLVGSMSAALATKLRTGPITFHPRKPWGLLKNSPLILDKDVLEEGRGLAAILQHGQSVVAMTC